jgi:hypothetical protein
MFANIFRRETIEASYPRDVFENDAGLNSIADAVILHGVFIGSAPDEQGQFRIARATRQVGEAPREPGSLFLTLYGQGVWRFFTSGRFKGCRDREPRYHGTPP